MGDGPPREGCRGCRPAGAARTFHVGSLLVLDLVFVLGVLALFALVSAVAAGVEKL